LESGATEDFGVSSFGNTGTGATEGVGRTPEESGTGIGGGEEVGRTPAAGVVVAGDRVGCTAAVAAVAAAHSEQAV
jgi:hypothetical protein